MKRLLASADFAVLLVLIGIIVSIMLPGCSTYQGLKTDVHELSNPHWR